MIKYTPDGDLVFRIPIDVWDEMHHPQSLAFDDAKQEVVCTLAGYRVGIEDLRNSTGEPDGECRTFIASGG